MNNDYVEFPRQALARTLEAAAHMLSASAQLLMTEGVSVADATENAEVAGELLSGHAIKLLSQALVAEMGN